ncbi:DUF7695 domain-containing protein [Peribacillus sp. NPDC046944]
MCKCGTVGIDGRLKYPKHIYRSHQLKEDYVDLSEYKYKTYYQ